MKLCTLLFWIPLGLLAWEGIVFGEAEMSFPDMIEMTSLGVPAYSEPPAEVEEYQGPVTDFGLFLASRQKLVADARFVLPSLIQSFFQGSTHATARGESGNQYAPYVMLGGYWDTYVTATAGGTITLICYVSDLNNDLNPGDSEHPELGSSVELYYNQHPTGAFLFDDGRQGDFEANDGVYGITATIAQPYLLPPGQYLLELVARDYEGNESEMWPYLEIR